MPNSRAVDNANFAAEQSFQLEISLGHFFWTFFNSKSDRSIPFGHSSTQNLMGAFLLDILSTPNLIDHPQTADDQLQTADDDPSPKIASSRRWCVKGRDKQRPNPKIASSRRRCVKGRGGGKNNPWTIIVVNQNVKLTICANDISKLNFGIPGHERINTNLSKHLICKFPTKKPWSESLHIRHFKLGCSNSQTVLTRNHHKWQPQRFEWQASRPERTFSRVNRTEKFGAAKGERLPLRNERTSAERLSEPSSSKRTDEDEASVERSMSLQVIPWRGY